MSSLPQLQEMITKCKACPLYKGTTHAVPGSGSASADVMFVGEAPGRKEDLTGEPFVGAAGKFLNVMLESVGLQREDVFITSILKHRPPDNRDPKPAEIKACVPYLLEQIRQIKPKIIVLLGRHAMGFFLPGKVISEVHGRAQYASGVWGGRQLFLPLYHPAAALYNPNMKKVHLEDFQKILELLKTVRGKGR